MADHDGEYLVDGRMSEDSRILHDYAAETMKETGYDWQGKDFPCPIINSFPDNLVL